MAGVQWMQPSFSLAFVGEAYRDGWQRIFGCRAPGCERRRGDALLCADHQADWQASPEGRLWADWQREGRAELLLALVELRWRRRLAKVPHYEEGGLVEVALAQREISAGLAPGETK